ncbi:hypothetical protein [Loktanella fryxellensis]|uniref:hypothetical protein n=1 Tax=Loktanella fryxellensis TaxID=245187 RepID=UPI000B7D900C|nr:hypothetical protein [Loktanella fryxellensis]
MEYLDLLWLLPAASIAYVTARIAAGNRRFKRELEDEGLAAFHDMAAAWRESRSQDAAGLDARTEQQGPAGARSASDLERDLNRAQASLPRKSADDTAAQREVRLATAAMLSALKAHPDIFK